MLVMVNFNKSLQPGQGITIGNQLRRVLLGDLGGIAISAVRIAGVTHEFSTIPGVREDILEILLNLKGIVVKNKTQDIELTESARAKCYNGRFNSVTFKFRDCKSKSLYCNNFYLKHS
jgi:DNA-directed RNA polymerase alpha subunit